MGRMCLQCPIFLVGILPFGNTTDYMPVPPSPVGGQGFAPISNWARGSTPGQASFQTPRWVLSSSTRQDGPFSSPTAGDGADDGSAERFASDSIKDDDSPQVSHYCCIMMQPLCGHLYISMYFLDIAPRQARYVCIILPHSGLRLYFDMASVGVYALNLIYWHVINN